MIDKLRHTDAARDIYFNEAGETYPIGTVVKNLDMQRMPERIRDGGAEVFIRRDRRGNRT